MKHDLSMSDVYVCSSLHIFMLWVDAPVVLSLKRKHGTVPYRHQLVHLCEDAVSCLWHPSLISCFSWLLRGHHSDFFISLRNKQAVFFFLVWYLPTACWILFFKAILRLHPQDGNQCILFSASKQIAWAISCIIWILYSKKDWFVVNTLYCNIYYFYLIQC